MAQKSIVVLTDDLDGGDADETLRFSLDGSQYEIDLSEKNATRLRESLAPFVTAARRSGGRPASRRRPGSVRHAADETAAIRGWAQLNGWPNIADRGRIAGEIVEKYRQANG
jgi:hypothetical protein